MKSERFLTTFITHALLILGVLVVCFPIYVALIAATHTAGDLLRAPIPLLPGQHFLNNMRYILMHGMSATEGQPIYIMLWNSLLMALFIAIGKIVLSILSAYAIVYFDFPFKRTSFWLIFLTLMLPVEVRILPTFQVVANLQLLDTFSGLSLPLLASATATFLFRQFFMTIPTELCEAARLDGAGPLRFFTDVLLPLSKTNIAALFIIMFIYGWNQYLWPLVVTTKSSMNTIVMGIQKLASVADQVPEWNNIMAVALLAMLPPVIIVVLMQRLFEKGLLEQEK